MARIHKVSQFDDPALDAYARLTEAQLRNRLEPEKGIFIAESPKVITRALDAGFEPVSLLMERSHLERDAAAIVERIGDVPVYVGDGTLLKQLTGFELTRGVLCAMKRPQLPAVEELLRDARRIAVLEGIVDHTNVGTIFRSAAALGLDAVLVTPTCCDPLYRRSARVSMGAVFQVPWTRIGESADDWPDAGMARLAACGFTTAALALSDDSISLDDPALASAERLALILGTEGDGLSGRTIELADHVVRIPMAHGVDSLNVAAAAAVAFWELRRR